MASVGRIELYTYCWTILRQVPYPLDQITIGFFDIIMKLLVSVKTISFGFSKIFVYLKYLKYFCSLKEYSVYIHHCAFLNYMGVLLL